MELVYRGVRYNNNKSALSIATQGQNQNIDIVSDQPEIATKDNFPLLKYIKQFFSRSKAKRVFNPFLFWYKVYLPKT